MLRLSIIILLTLTCLGLGCSDQAENAGSKVIKPVKYATIAQDGGIQIRTFSGTTRSAEETNLSFRTNGLIVRINVKVGDRVRKGQLLAQLDQRDLSLSYDQANASVQSAKIALETAKSNLERTKELYQANSASLSDYENARNNYAGAQSSYQTAKKAMDLQASQFNYAKIVASTSGVVSAVNAEVNEFAQAGSPIIVMSSVGAGIEVNVGVPESYITKLSSGDSVQVKVGEQDLEGIVTEVGFSSSTSTTYPVIIKLSQLNDNIRPGMPARVTFAFGKREEVSNLFVPVKAVGEDANGNFVFLLQAQSENQFMVKKTSIEIGALGDRGFLLLSGLKEGELVATAGLRSLYDGRMVSLLEN